MCVNDLVCFVSVNDIVCENFELIILSVVWMKRIFCVMCMNDFVCYVSVNYIMCCVSINNMCCVDSVIFYYYNILYQEYKNIDQYSTKYK